jgi:hypothetical protein
METREVSWWCASINSMNFNSNKTFSMKTSQEAVTIVAEWWWRKSRRRIFKVVDLMRRRRLQLSSFIKAMDKCRLQCLIRSLRSRLRNKQH